LRLKDDATKTMASFKEHFNKEDSERKRKLTAKSGGYHGAHGADSNRPWYYCWSHGLGIDKQHTSPTCTFKKDGHIDTATADNVQGRCNLIMGPPRQRRRDVPPAGKGT
jgi:hypothetical protein